MYPGYWYYTHSTLFFDINLFQKLCQFFFLEGGWLERQDCHCDGRTQLGWQFCWGKQCNFSKRIHETQICLCLWKSCFSCEFHFELCLSGAGPLLRREHWICYSLETLAFGCHCGGDDPLSKGLLETLQSRGGQHLPLLFLSHYINVRITGSCPQLLWRILSNGCHDYQCLDSRS